MYHINRKGLPAKCTKGGESCSLGRKDEHFTSEKEAQRYADKLMSESFSIIPVVDTDFLNINSGKESSNLKNTYSELLVSARFVKNKEAYPVLLLGVDSNGDKVYEFISRNKGSFYDINGVVSSNKEELQEKIADKYNIADKDSLKYIDYPASLNMIKILTSIDILDENAKSNLETYIRNKIELTEENEDRELMYITNELN